MLFGLIPWGTKPERKTWSGDHIRQGDPVVSFEARGCMGEDHVFQWIGVVDHFCRGKIYDGNVDHDGQLLTSADYAEVRPVKFGHIDERDVPQLHPYRIYLEDRSLQRLPCGIWIYMQ